MRQMFRIILGTVILRKTGLSTDGQVYADPSGVSFYQDNWSCSGIPSIEQAGSDATEGSHFDEECFVLLWQ
jgi:hypothetical protein